MKYEEIKKVIKYYEKLTGHKPRVIRMTQKEHDELQKQIEEKFPMVNIPRNKEHETIFGIPIDIIEEDAPT